MYFAYILYSTKRNKYYAGCCQNVDERLKKHNNNHSGFTGKTSDWILKLSEPFNDKTSALKREKQIKSRKSPKMIEQLINEAG